MTWGQKMASLRRALFVLLTWTTAASTLLAGLPHSVCGCPESPAKSSKRTPEQSRECCCGGCCPAGEPHPCCRDSAGSRQQAEVSMSTPEKAPAGPVAEPSRCQKAPAQAASTSILEKSGTEMKRSLEPLAKSPILVALGLLPESHSEAAPATQAPPPTDLVIALQHFLI